jgi:hypothetical protein
VAKAGGSRREHTGALDRLSRRVPGFRGYLEPELRRPADRSLRDHGAAQLSRIGGDLGRRADARELLLQIEKLASELRAADRGYSSFFDEPKLDGGPALDAAYAQDERLLGQLDELEARAGEPELSSGALRGLVKRVGLVLADRRNALLALQGGSP